MAERKERKPGAVRVDATQVGDRVEVRVGDLRADPSNRRRRTARGRSMLVEALGKVGAARSIVIDEDNEILAGNGIVEAATEAGIHRVQVVEADGDTIIAVRRRGLTPQQKRDLSMYDNRVAELAEWDPGQIGKDAAGGLELQAFFTDAELAKLTKDKSGREPIVEEVQTGPVADRFWISVRGPLAAQAKALQQLRALMKDLEGVEVELGTQQSIEMIPV